MARFALASASLLVCLSGCSTSVAVDATRSPSTAEAAPRVTNTIFIEAAGMDLTPPDTCDPVTATNALADTRSSYDSSMLVSACADACRPAVCQGFAIEAEVMGVGYRYDLALYSDALALACGASEAACTTVGEVVLMGKELDATLLTSLAIEPVELAEPEPTPSEGAVEPASEQDPELARALEAACDQGDAASCFALVDLDVVLFGYEYEVYGAREAALRHWDKACKLEPLTYCGGLDVAYEYVYPDEGCAG